LIDCLKIAGPTPLVHNRIVPVRVSH
jgi:hypothetical protein